MPRRCCMPNCSGNYDNGPKVSVFYFPSDENLRRKWLSAVHRQDWTPSKHSVICELHFNKDDILSSTSMYDPKTGILLTAPLDRRRLRKDAIPSKLPGCPSYLSSHQTAVREDPEIRRGRLENRALQIAIQESVDTHAKMIDAISFDSLEQMKTKLSECEKHSDWVVINKSDSVRLVLLKHNPYPRIFCHVVISSGLLLSVFNLCIKQ
ncbi:THAP domain-containing protein 5-like [Schistocerca piceifrons]|uniref:THAP domain-containing protein 5-like n=1 Tax=Schistocerca piceifrons TaxID=274613 RepID=UPI001F5EE7BD|nr:THAP domain-containing protein 5-like [Schistocerca piceifrons]